MCTNLNFRMIFGMFLLITTISTVASIRCYQCSSTNSTKHPFQCNEWLSDYDLSPESCDDVYGAKYCVKHIGRFEVSLLKCYQCSSATSIYCADGLIHTGGLQPESCDHVFEAQYCIKALVLDGGIGAKRFCSSLDLGNYCNYVKQPGDKLEYRTCVYTCTGDGCNSAPHITILRSMLILSLGLIYFFRNHYL